MHDSPERDAVITFRPKMGSAHTIRSPSAVLDDADERHKEHPATKTLNQRVGEILARQPRLTHSEAMRIALARAERT